MLQASRQDESLDTFDARHDMVPESILIKEENGIMDRVNRYCKISLKAVALLAVSLMITSAPSIARAETAKEIDVSTDVSLESFTKEVKGAKEFLQASKGVLVF